MSTSLMRRWCPSDIRSSGERPRRRIILMDVLLRYSAESSSVPDEVGRPEAPMATPARTPVGTPDWCFHLRLKGRLYPLQCMALVHERRTEDRAARSLAVWV